MKLIFKKVFIVLTAVMIFLLPSCEQVEQDLDIEYKVTFVFGDGSQNKTISVKSGETASIEAPTREGYEFVGWCTDNKLTNFYDFTSALNSNLTLYAKWDIDYKHLFSRVASEASSSVVEITSNAGVFGITKQGSGVIYKETSDTYYAITNNHVVTKDSGVSATAVYATDVYGNKYSATLLKSDPAYDLALVSFSKKSGVQLEISELSDRIPDYNERTVTVSVPNGKMNTAELADMQVHREVDNESSSIDGVSDVDFKVLWLFGNADHGSSGGAVFDTDLKLVGIIYGNIEIKETEKTCIIAIPSSKVIEFLGDGYK